MATISKPYTFTVGATIIASEHNSNFDTIYSDYNGNITNANISGTAAISDSKLSQISTASKVSGAALTSLSSVPSGAGQLPTANGGTGQDWSSQLIGGIPYISAVGTLAILAAGTSGTFYKSNGGGAAPSATTALISSILDYGSSASASTARLLTALKIAFGFGISVSGGNSAAITNLAFTSSSSYTVIVSAKSSFGTPPAATDQNAGNLVAVMDSGSQFTIYNTDDQTKTVNWFAIGI